eukprot:Rmarinus@m.12791
MSAACRKKAFRALLRFEAITDDLKTLTDSYNIQPFLLVFLRQLIPHAQLDADSAKLLQFAMETLPIEGIATELATVVLESSGNSGSEDAQRQSRQTLQWLHLRYPNQLEAAVRDWRAADRSTAKEQVVSLLEGSWHEPILESDQTLALSLDHADPKIRLAAVLKADALLAAGGDETKSSWIETMQGSLLRRVCDEDADVVKAVLKSSAIVDSLPAVELYDSLRNIVLAARLPSSVLRHALKAMTSEVILKELGQKTLDDIALVLLPHLWRRPKTRKVHIVARASAVESGHPAFAGLPELTNEDTDVEAINSDVVKCIAENVIKNPDEVLPLLARACSLSWHAVSEDGSASNDEGLGTDDAHVLASMAAGRALAFLALSRALALAATSAVPLSPRRSARVKKPVVQTTVVTQASVRIAALLQDMSGRFWRKLSGSSSRYALVSPAAAIAAEASGSVGVASAIASVLACGLEDQARPDKAHKKKSRGKEDSDAALPNGCANGFHTGDADRMDDEVDARSSASEDKLLLKAKEGCPPPTLMRRLCEDPSSWGLGAAVFGLLCVCVSVPAPPASFLWLSNSTTHGENDLVAQQAKIFQDVFNIVGSSPYFCAQPFRPHARALMDCFCGNPVPFLLSTIRLDEDTTQPIVQVRALRLVRTFLSSLRKASDGVKTHLRDSFSLLSAFLLVSLYNASKRIRRESLECLWCLKALLEGEAPKKGKSGGISAWWYGYLDKDSGNHLKPISEDGLLLLLRGLLSHGEDLVADPSFLPRTMVSLILSKDAKDTAKADSTADSVVQFLFDVALSCDQPLLRLGLLQVLERIPTTQGLVKSATRYVLAHVVRKSLATEAQDDHEYDREAAKIVVRYLKDTGNQAEESDGFGALVALLAGFASPAVVLAAYDVPSGDWLAKLSQIKQMQLFRAMALCVSVCHADLALRAKQVLSAMPWPASIPNTVLCEFAEALRGEESKSKSKKPTKKQRDAEFLSFDGVPGVVQQWMIAAVSLETMQSTIKNIQEADSLLSGLSSALSAVHGLTPEFFTKHPYQPLQQGILAGKVLGLDDNDADYIKRLLLGAMLPVLRSAAPSELETNEQPSELPRKRPQTAIARPEQSKRMQAVFAAARSVDLDAIAEIVLQGSPQLRNLGLLILAAIAPMRPESILKHAVSLFSSLGRDSMQREDRYTRGVLEETISSIVPPLLRPTKRSSESKRGKTAHEATSEETPISAKVVLEAFVDSAAGVPNDRLLCVFDTLASAISEDSALPVICFMLLEKECRGKVGGKSLDSASEGEGVSWSAADFAHEFLEQYPVYVQLYALASLLRLTTPLFVVSDTVDDGEKKSSKSSKNVPPELVDRVLSAVTNRAIAVPDQPPPPLLDTATCGSEFAKALEVGLVQFVSSHLGRPVVVGAVLDTRGDQSARSTLDDEPEHLDRPDLNLFTAAFQDLFEVLLGLLPVIGRYLDICRTTAKAKKGKEQVAAQALTHWMSVLNAIYDTLSRMNEALDPAEFVDAIVQLVGKTTGDVRHKALDLFVRRVSNAIAAPKALRLEEHLPEFVRALPLLESVCQNQGCEVVTRQTAMLGIQRLADVITEDASQPLVHTLEVVSALVLQEPASKKGGHKASREEPAGEATATADAVAIRASALLCVGALVRSLGVRALEQLSSFFPRMIDLLPTTLTEQTTEDTHLVAIAAVRAVCSIAEALPLFLSPYLPSLVPKLLHPRLLRTDEAPHTLRTLGASVRPDLLLPPVLATCNEAISSTLDLCARSVVISGCCDVLKCVLEAIPSKTDMEKHSALSFRLILKALDFRRLCCPDATDAVVSESQAHAWVLDAASEAEEFCQRVEDGASDALFAMTLKLPEKPHFNVLFRKLLEWASLPLVDVPQASDGNEDEEEEDRRRPSDSRLRTFFRLCSTLGRKLRGIMAPYFAYTTHLAADVLRLTFDTSGDTAKGQKKANRKRKRAAAPNAPYNLLLVRQVAMSLQQWFLHDNETGSITKEAFHQLMRPAVQQLDTLSDLSARARKQLRRLRKEGASDNAGADCERLQHTMDVAAETRGEIARYLGLLSAAVKDQGEVLWKPLLHAVLTLTRGKTATVRLASVEVLKEVMARLAEDFLLLMPETLPYLAELLEDDDEEVERAANRLVKQIQELSGEDVKSLFK